MFFRRPVARLSMMTTSWCCDKYDVSLKTEFEHRRCEWRGFRGKVVPSARAHEAFVLIGKEGLWRCVLSIAGPADGSVLLRPELETAVKLDSKKGNYPCNACRFLSPRPIPR